MSPVIPFDQALEIVLAAVRPMAPTALSLEEAAGRVLAEAVRARHDAPRFDQSAMDGVAVRAADLAGASPARPIELALSGDAVAGAAAPTAVRAGRAVRIFTGAPLPAGADAVVMQERCVLGGGRVRFDAPAAVGQNVRVAGEEQRAGAPLLAAGVRLTPAAIGALAANGDAMVTVIPPPRAALITLGDELVAPGQPLTGACIYDANGPALAAALRALGVREVAFERVSDEPDELREALERALARADVVITAAGASVGDHDHVAAMRAALGISTEFACVAIKPGKPNLFGRSPTGVPVFGLPGNPVAALVSFNRLVAPAIRRMSGRDPLGTAPVEATLAGAIDRKAGRLEWLRGRLEHDDAGLRAAPVARQGSHMLSSLTAATALIEIPADVGWLPAGAPVRCWPLDWSA